MLNGRSAIQEEQPRNNQGLFENHVFQVSDLISLEDILNTKI